MKTFVVIPTGSTKLAKIKGTTKQSAIKSALKKNPPWRNKLVVVMTLDSYERSLYSPLDLMRMR